jgi:hypothetical protein
MKQIKTFTITFVAMLILMLIVVSCRQQPVLQKGEYKVVDTTHTSRNGINMVLGYDVIIKIDSSYYAGSLNPDKELIRVNPRKLKLQK